MTTLSLPQIDSASSRYVAYAYAYPHKTAYRHLNPPVPLAKAWLTEARDSLFLYVHIPFCEMRCGFCNLFTLAQPREAFVASYLQALETEAHKTREALGVSTFTQMAIGGGTPTFLHDDQLERLFDLLGETFALRLGQIPLSVESSPGTATLPKMRLLKRSGVSRVSIGVQSFIESEVAASGRAQSNAQVKAAVDNVRAAGISILNLDLIYGLPGQTVASWMVSIEQALVYRPEELYLYPLYVRPLTGISRRELQLEDSRDECYTAARDALVQAGYAQVSMRMFRLANTGGNVGTAYCCQDDGMVGIGCGVCSYTRGLHYSREFAVGREGVRSILRDYIVRPAQAFEATDYGCTLDADEQRRRYVIKSILRADGMSRLEYRDRFGSDALDDIPEMHALIRESFLNADSQHLIPTQRGLDYSDLIGPWLFSPAMRTRMEEFDLR